MKRVLVAIAVSALAFGAGAVGAKVVNVTNPMTADLNANGWNINDAGTITAGSVVAYSYFVHPPTNLVVAGGTGNPSTDPVAPAPVDRGSLFLSTTGVWVYLGGFNQFNWECIAACTP